MKKTRKVTISDIAAAAGVSKATVSRYINGHTELMTPKTAERIRTVIDMTDYSPSEIARNLKKKTTNIVGVIVSDIASPFSSSLIIGISNHLNQLGYTPLIATCDNSLEKEQNAVSSFISKGASGIIVNTTSYENDYLIEQSLKGLPIVLCDRYIKNHNFNIVTTENHAIFHELINHLKKNGYTRIALFTEKVHNNSTRMKRVEAFQASMKELFEDSSDNVYEIDRNVEASTPNALRQFLDRMGPDDIPAVIGVNSISTVLLYSAVKQFNLSIPNDIGICGPEDWGWNTAMNWPSLMDVPVTTFVIHPQEIGLKAAELLLSIINEPSRSTEEIITPSHLCVRQSTVRLYPKA